MRYECVPTSSAVHRRTNAPLAIFEKHSWPTLKRRIRIPTWRLTVVYRGRPTGENAVFHPASRVACCSFSNGTPKTKPCLVKRMSDETSSPPSGCETRSQPISSPVAKNKLQKSLHTGERRDGRAHAHTHTHTHTHNQSLTAARDTDTPSAAKVFKVKATKTSASGGYTYGACIVATF